MRLLVGLILMMASLAALQAKEPVPEAAVLPPEIVEVDLKDLSVEQVQQALSAIQQKQVGAEVVDEAGLSRATLLGLIEEFRPGIELTDGKAPEEKKAAFHSEVLAENTGYVRLGSLSSENLAQLDAALKGFSEAKVNGMILDLRATPESQNFVLAADVAGRFVPEGTKIFSLVGRTPETTKEFMASGSSFSGLLVVIVDAETRGASEAIAASLRHHVHAMIVGGETGGRTVEFEDLPLGEGRFLRLGTREVRIENAVAIYPKGVTPDLIVRQEPAERDAIFAAAAGKNMANFVFEKGRKQFNEAALMEGTNPEIEEQMQEDKDGKTPRIWDRPLQRAMDLIVAIRIFKGKV